jgi:hypothetical protein
MLIIQGEVIAKHATTTKKGNPVNLIEVLLHHKKFSEVIQVADYDNHTQDLEKGKKASIPISLKINVKGERAYKNYIAQGGDLNGNF